MKRENYNNEVLSIFTFKYNPLKYLYHKFRIPIIIYRTAKIFFNKKITQKVNIKINDFSFLSEQYKRKGYVFIENFFDLDTYNHLIKNWPNKNYFKPGKSIYKSYDFAFKWTPKIKSEFKIDEPSYIKNNSISKGLLNHFFSNTFAKLITEFCDDGIKRKAYSFVATHATSGSTLIPHMDGISVKEGGHSFINIILFINSSNHIPEECGGTGIYQNPSYDKPIFIPSTLKNSALIYKSDKKLFHGYKPMKKGAFRWTYNIQFSSENFLLNDAKKYSEMFS